MGNQRSNISASDEDPPREARGVNPHSDPSSPCASPTESAPQSPQETTHSGNPTESSPGPMIPESQLAFTPVNPHDALQRSPKPTQQSSRRKQPRKLAPAPKRAPFRTLTPEEPKEEPKLDSIVGENGNLKIRVPRLDPTPRPRPLRHVSTSSSSPLAPPTEPPPHVPSPPEEPLTPSHVANPRGEVPPPPFDPSRCHWRALRDVAFVQDRNIQVSMEDLCALLRFRYADRDPLMDGVGRSEILAMDMLCRGIGKEMYEPMAVGFIKERMEEDLRRMRDGRPKVLDVAIGLL